MPKFGLTMTEGRIIEWRVELGECVARGDVLLVIESEKAEIEVTATAAGILRHIYVEPGRTVACGTLLAAISDGAEEVFDAQGFHRDHDTPEKTAAAHAPRAATPAVRGAERTPRQGRKAVAPAARGLAKELGFDTDAIPGTGPGGRVTKGDVKAWAQAREALVEVAPGVSLEVPTLGAGDPVLLLPGFGTDVSVFARQSAELAKSFRVVGINPRGVGMSDASDEEAYGPRLLARDAMAVIDEPAHIIGASMGAAVAIEMAIEQPERVRSLTLITPAVEVSARLEALLAAWCLLADMVAPEMLASTLLPWLFGDGVLADEHARARMQRGLAAILPRIPAHVLARYASGIGAWHRGRGPDLTRIAAPTLVLTASEDLMTAGGARLADAIAGAEHVVVANSGHAVCLEAPGAVNEAIAAHLDAARGAVS